MPPEPQTTSTELDEIAVRAQPLDDVDDLDPLLDRIGDARLVLLGEASHGTSECYSWRADLTRRLIDERGFSFVAVGGGLARLLPGQPIREGSTRRRWANGTTRSSCSTKPTRFTLSASPNAADSDEYETHLWNT